MLLEHICLAAPVTPSLFDFCTEPQLDSDPNDDILGEPQFGTFFNDYNNQQGYSVSEQDEHLSRAQRVIPGSCDSCTRTPTRFWSL